MCLLLVYEFIIALCKPEATLKALAVAVSVHGCLMTLLIHYSGAA